MTPVLVERYAKDGSEKARRQMLALCQTDPDILADVLGHLVEMASQKLNESTVTTTASPGSEAAKDMRTTAQPGKLPAG